MEEIPQEKSSNPFKDLGAKEAAQSHYRIWGLKKNVQEACQYLENLVKDPENYVVRVNFSDKNQANYAL